MLLKNKILFKRIFAIIFPIALVVGVSCFFFINVDWDKYTAETWRQMIITWILSYGGIILLFVKAVLTAISAKKILATKPIKKVVVNERSVDKVLLSKKDKRSTKRVKKHDKSEETIGKDRFTGYSLD